jgi:hypothetical protein
VRQTLAGGSHWLLFLTLAPLERRKGEPQSWSAELIPEPTRQGAMPKK